MNNERRAYSPYAENAAAKSLLNKLLHSTHSPLAYQETMTSLGHCLGDVVAQKVSSKSICLVASTAEDADYLADGVRKSIEKACGTFSAVFWNNHYSIPNGSVAPVVHKYLQPGFESSDSLVMVKSIISGSCVVRTNVLALIERLPHVRRIFIVAPVTHTKSEEALRSEFPEHISSLFEFIYLAQDSVKDDKGEIHPGIGGQIYQLLGMEDQPVRVGFVPKIIKQLTAVSPGL